MAENLCHIWHQLRLRMAPVITDPGCIKVWNYLTIHQLTKPQLSVADRPIFILHIFFFRKYRKLDIFVAFLKCLCFYSTFPQGTLAMFYGTLWFRGNLVGKHCCRLLDEESNQYVTDSEFLKSMVTHLYRKGTQFGSRQDNVFTQFLITTYTFRIFKHFNKSILLLLIVLFYQYYIYVYHFHQNQ